MSQPPSDKPEPVPPWDAFSGDDPPPPGPRLTALLGDAAGAIGELDPRQLLGAGSAARRLRAFSDYVEIVSVAELAASAPSGWRRRRQGATGSGRGTRSTRPRSSASR